MEHPRMRAAREAVVKYYNYKIAYNDTSVVWFSDTPREWKAVVKTTESGVYFEVTYDRDIDAIRLDAYKKVDEFVDYRTANRDAAGVFFYA